LRLATLGPEAEPLAAALSPDEELVAAFLGATGPVALTSARLLFGHKGELWTPPLSDLAGASVVRRACEFSLRSGSSWRYRGLEDPAAVAALLNAAAEGAPGCDGVLFAACYGAVVVDGERVLAVAFDGTLRLMLTSRRLVCGGDEVRLSADAIGPRELLVGGGTTVAVEHPAAWAALVRSCA